MRISIFLVGLILAQPLAAANAGPPDLALFGRGELHYLGFIKVYSARLYVTSGTPAGKVLDHDRSRCLILEYDVSLSAEDFVRAAETVLKRQHAETTLARVHKELEQLHSSYRNVKKGDRYRLCYAAMNETTSLELNGSRLASIPSAEFAQIYFGIWLSDHDPIDRKLREQLLAGTN